LSRLWLTGCVHTSDGSIPRSQCDMRVARRSDLEADDSMILGGMIDGVKANGQEGELRAIAVVIECRA